MMLLETFYQQFTPSVIAASALRCAGKLMQNLPHSDAFSVGTGPNMEALDLVIEE